LLDIVSAMNVGQETKEQIENAYRRMAEEAKYRPAAPSDGFGNIEGAEEDLDLDAEADSYVGRWWREEDRGIYNVGVPDAGDREALIFTIEAARLLCGTDRVHSAKLLRMAADNLDARVGA
jgi:hypothetical protein